MATAVATAVAVAVVTAVVVAEVVVGMGKRESLPLPHLLPLLPPPKARAGQDESASERRGVSCTLHRAPTRSWRRWWMSYGRAQGTR